MRGFYSLRVIVPAWFFLWLIVFRESATAAVKVWYINDTYVHCFFVIPLAVYFFYANRHQIEFQPAKINPWIVLSLLPTAALWFVGTSGGVNPLVQMAAVVLVWQAAAVLFGVRFLQTAWFPLSLLIFMVPIGEELVPQLREITAGVSVALLRLSGLSVWRDGMYITIPEGIFYVAAACSGIKFLIASVFVGYVAAFLEFTGAWRRALFVVFAGALSLTANSVRVYITVLVGHVFGMQAVSGFDHIVYGWLLFALVFVTLIASAFYFSNKGVSDVSRQRRTQPLPKVRVARPAIFYAFAPLLTLLLAQPVMTQWLYPSALPQLRLTGAAPHDWHPAFPGATSHGFIAAGFGSDVFTAGYDGREQQGELINSQNRIFDVKRWKIEEETPVEIGSGHQMARFLLLRSTQTSVKRALLYWYQVGDVVSYRGIPIKLAQFKNILQGKGRGGVVYAISRRMEASDTPDEVREKLLGNARSLRTQREATARHA